MRGHPDIIQTLNDLLAVELTSIDIYVLQAAMLEDWGLLALHARLAHEADDERLHANELIARILFLGGEPDVTTRVPAKVGADAREMLAEDLALERQVGDALNKAIALCVERGDNGTRMLLETLLTDTESDHELWLKQQLTLIDQVGLQNYLAVQMRAPAPA